MPVVILGSLVLSLMSYSIYYWKDMGLVSDLFGVIGWLVNGEISETQGFARSTTLPILNWIGSWPCEQ